MGVGGGGGGLGRGVGGWVGGGVHYVFVVTVAEAERTKARR